MKRNMLSRIESKLLRKTNAAHLLEIDGLRVIALLPVLLHHLGERVIRVMQAKYETFNGEWIFHALPSGRLGVEIFFVISGFVISMPFIKKWIRREKWNSPNLKAYFTRRLVRLEPPYILVMLASFLAVILLDMYGIKFSDSSKSFNSEISSAASLLTSLFYLHGIVFQIFPKFNPPAWSLEIEFQFYVLAPFLLLAIFRVNRLITNKDRFLIITFLFLVLLKTAGVLLFDNNYLKFFVFNYLEFFIIGFFLAKLYFEGHFEKYHKGFLTASLIFFLGIFLAFYGDFHRSKVEGINDIFDLCRIFGISMIFYGTFSGGVGKSVFRLKWIVIIGGMCYTIYLIHLIIFQITTKILMQFYLSNDFLTNMLVYGITSLVVLFASSLIFYILIEKPFMDLSSKFRSKKEEIK